MKKEHLALALIIVCLAGAVIGMFKTLKDPARVEKVETRADRESRLIGMLGKYDKIAIIRLNGMITDVESDTDFFLNSSPAARARKYLNKATKDKNVKGVLFRVNSPGGTVGASQEIYSAILRCRKDKPVVVSMGDVAASGGYYVASAGDYIVANPGTITGSIGVILNALNFEQLMNKVGVKSHVVKSGEFKDIGSAYRSMTNKEQELLQGLINNTYDQFVDDIVKARLEMLDEKSQKDNKTNKLTEDELRKVADGRILTGQQAYEIGLIDELGDYEKAREITVKLAQKRFKNVKDSIPVEIYDRPQTLSEYLVELTNNLKPEASFGIDLPFSAKNPNVPLWVME
jgi:protease-4